MQKKQKEKIEKKEPTKQIEIVQIEKNKSILKPFALFAVFVACIGGAVLYPYFNERLIIYPPIKKKVIQNIVTERNNEKPLYLYDVEEKHEVGSPSPVIQSLEESCVLKDKLILNQKQTIDDLNEKIHRLELENFNLSEKMQNWDKLIPLTAQLINEIHTGEPFVTTLNLLLMHDKTNAFALNIEGKLSNFASVGLPTPNDLKQRFLKTMDIAKKSFYVRKENKSWNENVMSYFKSLFFIYPEKIDIQKEQVINNQFSLAIKTIEKLPPNVQNLLNGFVKDADNYLSAQQIINDYLKR